MNASAGRTPGRAMMILVPLVASGLMILIGWRPTSARGGEPAVAAMILAQAVLLAASYASVVPATRKMAGLPPSRRFALAFRAGAVRFAATLGLSVALVVAGAVPRQAFLVWVGMGYVVLTLAETVALVRWMKALEG
jgi:hypothetical protein